MAQGRKHVIASALCKRLSLDPIKFSGDIESCDVKSLCTNILKSSENGSLLLSNAEAMKWIDFAESFPVDSAAYTAAIIGLNDELLLKSVLGNGLTTSAADVIVYSTIHPCVVAMSKSDAQKFRNVLRWMDYVQNKEDFGGILEKISVEKVQFEPPVFKSLGLVEANSIAKDSAKNTKADANAKQDTTKESKTVINGPEADKKSQKDSTQRKAKGDKANAEQKKPEAETAPKDEVPVSLLNIQVGLIRKASKHPSADSLLVEEIDVGEAKVRQVVSGLAKYCNPDDLVNRRVVLITNVKPGKLRDIVSEGLVLCASNEDHSVVEPLLPPEGAIVGERVSFSGHEGKPEDVLNPKKKQLDKITPHLFTDETGVATYKGIPFMTSGGPCTSSVKKGSIK